MKTIGVVLVAGVILAVGCRSRDGEPCNGNSDCKTGLSCDYDVCATCATSRACVYEAKCAVDPEGSMKHGNGHRIGMYCLATEESCRQHKNCKEKGECRLEKGGCVR